MRGGLDDGSGALGGFFGVGEGGGVFHEDAGAYEDGFGAELHDQAASAGVAMPPAEKFGTGSFPAFATILISS